jgi:inward rectifier potassium channel
MENVNQDTGFGERSADMGGRMVNKDGSFNIRRIGIHVRNRVSNYQNMLTMKRWRFLIVILMVYLLINCVFTALFSSACIHSLFKSNCVHTIQRWQGADVSIGML